MIVWKRERNFTYTHIIPTSLVGRANRKVLVSTTPARDVGISHLRHHSVMHLVPRARAATCALNHIYSTAPVGRASLCCKNYQAQTVGHLAPGCEDELSGLDPANPSCLPLYGGHTETKGYSGGIGLCQLTVDPTIKTPIGSDTFLEFQSTSCAKGPRRTASRARSSRRQVVGIATSMGELDDQARKGIPKRGNRISERKSWRTNNRSDNQKEKREGK